MPWLVAAFNALYLKYDILAIGGFRESAAGLRASGLLTISEKVFLFRFDLLLGFLFVPLLLCLLNYVAFPKWLPLAVSSLFAVLAEISLSLEALVYKVTGTFATVKMMWMALAWALKNHDSSIVAIPLTDEISLITWIAIIGLFTAIAFTSIRRPILWLNVACLSVFGIGTIAGTLAVLPHAPEMSWSRPLLEIVLLGSPFDTTAHPKTLPKSNPELLELYRQASHIPESSQSGFFGQAPEYNVLLFVIEATPAEVFNPAEDSLRDMPNVRLLRQHSFVSSKHYTSFPVTNRATFSIFTSLYTKSAPGDIIGDHHVEIPGMIRNLKSAGYETAFYGYVWKVPGQRDDRMLSSLGFDKIVEPTINESLDRGGAETFTGPVEYTEAHDAEVLQHLREDIRQWTSRHQKFAAAFFPELSHDPWRQLAGQEPSSIQARGHALAVRQDAWLGELIDELKQDGALERTIIVVTSDHGLRFEATRPNQPAQMVSRGILKSLVIQVPLLIYAPEVLHHSVQVRWPTSHIDIAPTVLDLLGIKNGRELEEGTAIWNPGIAKRRLFLGMDTFGASGFVDGGGYYMSSSMGTIFKNKTLNFENRDSLAIEGEEAIQARKLLLEQDSIQATILSNLLAPPRRKGFFLSGS